MKRERFLSFHCVLNKSLKGLEEKNNSLNKENSNKRLSKQNFFLFYCTNCLLFFYIKICQMGQTCLNIELVFCSILCVTWHSKNMASKLKEDFSTFHSFFIPLTCISTQKHILCEQPLNLVLLKQRIECLQWSKDKNVLMPAVFSNRDCCRKL